MYWKYMIGIYIIQNIVTNKNYVGSSIDIDDRWSNHRARLNMEQHANRYLQRAWKKYGKESFTFTVLEQCLTEQLAARELHWIKLLKCMDPTCGYNMMTRTERSLLMCESTRAKKRDAAKKQWQLDDVRESMVDGLKRAWATPTERRSKGAVKSGHTRRDDTAVEAVDLDGSVVATYLCRREAFLANGRDRNIYRVLDGENSHCKGIVYRYKES